MEYVVERTGKNVEEAISFALEELGIDRENAIVEVLEEGNKGIFGLIGAKMAKVRVRKRETSGEKLVKYLQDIFDKMHVNIEMDMEEDDSSIFINIQGEDSGIIIGRRGDTLEALQYLASLVINKGEEDYKE